MTSGYVDYVIGNTAMNDALYAEPVPALDNTRNCCSTRVDKPLLYEPGTNWNYAHTNYVILGLALEKATGEEMSKLLSDKVLRPLGLTNTDRLTDRRRSHSPPCTRSARSVAISSKFPPAHLFTKRSTYWDPSWTITHGAIQTSNIYDLEATAGRHRFGPAAHA